MGGMTTTETDPGQRVTDGRRFGLLVRYETAHRARWAVVQWDGKPFTTREYPRSIRPA
jgi:hypothetical protein